jgi:hypothetical protein
MCDSFEIKNYSIVTSLNERNIFIKFTDNVNFISYECSADAKELRLQFELSDIYNIIKKCLSFEDGFDVKICVSSNIMKLSFNAKVGGFLKINFEASLREKIMSNDGQLTLNINKIEYKYETLLKKLEKLEKLFEKTQKENVNMIEALSNADIILSSCQSPTFGIFTGHIYKINTTEITVDCNPSRLGCNFNAPDLNKLELFYKLKKIKLNYSRENNLTNIKNKSVYEIEIECGNDMTFQRILGIDNLPNLETLIINNAPAFTNIVQDLSSIDHKIKNIKLLNCSSINKIEIQGYCQNKNINLSMA